MRQPEGIIFDMDGVLINSEPVHYEIEKLLFKRLGITVPDQVHRNYLGAAGDYMYNDLKSRYKLSGSIEELLEIDESFRCEYFKSRQVVEANDGVIILLNEIKQAGIKLAVATSSSPEMTRILLDRCGISPIFDAIVTTIEAGKSKPAPDVYLLAADKIDAKPMNCLVFEDSPNGLLAAKSAGMYCVAIASESVNTLALSGADYVIKTFSGITLPFLVDLFSLK